MTTGRKPPTVVVRRARLESRGAKSLWKTGGVLAALVTLLVLALAPPASAHVVKDSGEVYVSGGPCTWGRAEVSHGHGAGYAKASVAQDFVLQTPWGSYDCAYSGTTQGAGRMAVRYDWYKWNGSSWYICASTGWAYNPSRVHKYEIYYYFGYPWCGRGYYGTMSHSFTLNGTKWHGGPLWSGSHYLPA